MVLYKNETVRSGLCALRLGCKARALPLRNPGDTLKPRSTEKSYTRTIWQQRFDHQVENRYPYHARALWNCRDAIRDVETGIMFKVDSPTLRLQSKLKRQLPDAYHRTALTRIGRGAYRCSTEAAAMVFTHMYASSGGYGAKTCSKVYALKRFRRARWFQAMCGVTHGF